MKRCRIAAGWIMTVLVATAAGPALAQQGAVRPGETAGLAEEINTMNRSLERLVALMEDVVYQQSVDLVLKRIDLKQRALIPLSSDLRELEGQYNDRKADLQRMREMLEMQEEQVSSDELRGIDQPNSDARTMLREFQQMFESETERVEELERRVRFMQDELAEGQEQVKDLEARLDELLE